MTQLPPPRHGLACSQLPVLAAWPPHLCAGPAIALTSLPLLRVQEWSEAKARQDQQLESIETGLGHLKEIGAAMNDELQRHDILINEVGAGSQSAGVS